MNAWSRFRSLHTLDSDPPEHARPSDGLITFSVMWGLATILSLVSRMDALIGTFGLPIAAFSWLVIGSALALIARPRDTRLLLWLALLMCAHYALRLPVASNNQTIAFVMNASIAVVLLLVLVREKGATVRHAAYEQLRVIARALIAVMYIYGIFHKINTDFLDPQVSCAVSLYQPLTTLFDLQDNLLGRYGAIYSTFIVEAITLVALYWKRYFAVGLIIGLVFHYIIPISAFSWYMDFSSLVFALYMLSVPREVSGALYVLASRLFRNVSQRSAAIGAFIALAILLVIASLVVSALSFEYSDRPARLLWHSVWLIVWAVVGGGAMILVTRAALAMLPYSKAQPDRQPLWLYAFPAALFVSSFSPYIGLKTESSIAMFSNLHTEGGVTNHLMFDRPPYLFDYQAKLFRVLDSSDPQMRQIAQRGEALVELELARWLRKKPQDWISYVSDGQRFDRVTRDTFRGREFSALERTFLIFKPVDFRRPKVCTH